jgi:hypothetical protein
VRRCGRHIGIACAPKHFEVVIRGWGGKEGAVRCGEGKGFSGEAVHEIGRSVKALNPIKPEGYLPKTKGSTQRYLKCEESVLLSHFIEKYMDTTCGVQHRGRERTCGPETCQILGCCRTGRS